MKTPTSSKYAVLENKPIDQWKVTELKEELKRRRLKTGGLKDELIKRLDEALRAEMEETSMEPKNDNGVDDTVPENVAFDTVDLTEQPIVEAGDFELVASGNAEETMGNGEDVVGDTEENVGNAVANEVPTEGSGEKLGMVDNFEVLPSGLGDDPVFEEGIISDVAPVVAVDKASEEQQLGLSKDTVLGEGIVTAIDVSSVGGGVSKELKSVLVDDPVLGEGIVTATDVGSLGDEVSMEQQSGLVDDPILGEVVTATDVASVVVGDEPSKGFSSEKELCGDGLINDKSERDNRASREQEHSEDVTPAHEDVKLDSSDQNNQVSEVRTSIGFPVKSNNSVSNDSLSIFEKNDLKDNLIADNVKLESDVKLDMVLPSSSDLVPDVGELHPRDVDEPHENMVSVEETDNTVANADMSQKNYSAVLGSSEKLNLDRSSGDDSMEEDALVSKHIDSNFNSEDVVEKTNKNEVTAIKAESPVATAMDTDLPAEMKVIHDQKHDVATLSDKRKLSDEEAVVNNKPAKRQHRWKKESNIVTEPQVSNILPPAAQDVPQPSALRRSFSRSDSIVANDPPKEREVPPSTKPATNSLRIDHFLRPFTLKAVQEFLGKTGTVASFWMDHIKTHCYVTYSSIEEAEETRNAVYNLQWPPNGGRQLVAEFVDPEEVKLRLNPPPVPTPALPVKPTPTKGPEVSTGPQQSLRQQPALPPPPPIPNHAPVRERLLPPPPPIEKVDAPIVTLDDLFRKTKATPRIYYLPLSDEEVAEKAARNKKAKQ